MTAPFTTQLRSGRAPIELASGPGAITLRVEVADLWDTVRVVTLPTTPVGQVKLQVIETLLPATQYAEDYVLKHHGWEVLDEAASLGDVGVVNGSILLLAHRRRRPIR